MAKTAFEEEEEEEEEIIIIIIIFTSKLDLNLWKKLVKF